jgi:hypothetical protein
VVIAGVIALGLILYGAKKGIGACTTNPAGLVGECRREHVQHALAILGTVTAALAAVTQGRTAKKKSDRHLTEWRNEKDDDKLRCAHAYDFHHFKMVKFWWYTFFAGAVAAILAEFLDWWGKPFIDWWTLPMN